MSRDRVFFQWAEWLRGGYLRPPSSCASAERKYRSGESFGGDYRVSVDVLTGMRVERAVCSLGHAQREVVRSHFVYHALVPAELRYRATGLSAMSYANLLRIGRMRVLAQVYT